MVAADAAALAAGVSVREVTDLAELADVVALYATIWGRSENPPVTLELLRAFTKAGNYVGGAFEGDRLVGACVGFFHAPAEDALHSHIAGVAPGLNGRHVGFALKLHQRAWAMLRGVSEIAWTFDPLVSRNAYFNVVKLAASPGRVPDELLRPDARHHQRRRRLRPAAGALAAARPRGRRRLRRRQPAAVGRRRARRRRGRRARHRRRRRTGAGPTSTARPRWSPYPVTSLRCATPTRRWPSAGGSRCASRWRRCSPTAAGSPASTGPAGTSCRRDR